jgi:hypothetical protein
MQTMRDITVNNTRIRQVDYSEAILSKIFLVCSMQVMLRLAI